MIKSADIRQAIGRLIIEDAQLNLAVTFQRVDKPNCDYAYVQFRPSRKDEGFGIFQRNIKVDILVHLQPRKTEILNEELLDIVDALDEATSGYIPILDRCITIYNTAAHIFDGLLTYSFELDFTDYIGKLFKRETEGLEYMKQLCLEMNKNTTARDSTGFFIGVNNNEVWTN